MSDKAKRKISLYIVNKASLSGKKYKIKSRQTVRNNSPLGNYADKITERVAERVAAEKESKTEKTTVADNVVNSNADSSKKKDDLQLRKKRAEQLKQILTTAEASSAANAEYDNRDDEHSDYYTGNSEQTESIGISSEQSYSEKEKKAPSHFFDGTKGFNDSSNTDLQRKNAQTQAYKQAILQKQMQRRQSAVEMNYQQQVNAELIKNMRAKETAEILAKAETTCRENLIEGADELGGFVNAMSSGSAEKIIAQPFESIIKKNLSKDANQLIDGVETIAGTVSGADSIGNAASNIGVALAAQELKKSVKSFLKTSADQKTEDRLQKKYHYIDKKTEERLKRIENERKEALNGNAKTAAEKEIQKIERNKEQYKEKLAKQQRELQRRNAQKDIYIKHNRNNPAFEGSVAARTQKKLHSKKKNGIMLGGAGGAVFVGIGAVIIILVLICSLFSWISPYSYSLAGDDEESIINAETNEEILDGYVLLVKNYFDVKQAYFYLDYSDWYGGTYAYGDASINKAEYIAEFIDEIIDKIRESYEAEIKAANGDPATLESISRRMAKEIAEAMKTAQIDAEASFKELIDSLNDELAASEKRRHYEIYRDAHKNGVKDSDEFAGPIVGTNKFDDVEIHSDLSAEEMVALIAIYKTMTNTGEKPSASSEGEESENIYCITPKDIFNFFKKTEYIKIKQTFTHNNNCPGNNCIRTLEGDYKSGYHWKYSCLGDHDNMFGEMIVKTKDELIEKMVELLNDVDGVSTTKEECIEIFDTYIDMIDKEIGGKRRYFGADDNAAALVMYNMLIDPEQGEIPNNFWNDFEDESSGDEND